MTPASHPVVLVVAAHPDDEVLGCAGTLARHAMAGHQVHIALLTDGVSSREPRRTMREDEILRRRGGAIEAAKILGANPPYFLDFPDQRLDSVPLVEIVKSIEHLAAPLQPDIIYTHSIGDLNVDHRLACAAVLTAFRPTPGQSVSAIYGFEILSSTEWNFGAPNVAFQPARFVCISDVLGHKISALEAYDEEMREFPHPRSYDAVRGLAALRGSTVGVKAAEAFSVLREVVR
jgi:LmbE family N-acetylglucosaminyl deacetylase